MINEFLAPKLPPNKLWFQ